MALAFIFRVPEAWSRRCRSDCTSAARRNPSYMLRNLSYRARTRTWHA